MVTAVYDVGDAPRLTATFLNASGTPTDPTAVTFRVREPDGTVTAYVYGTDPELIKSSTGVYYVDWPCTQRQRHYVRFEGTGTVAAIVETEFVGKGNSVNPS
jgi:hypothetical protein